MNRDRTQQAKQGGHRPQPSSPLRPRPRLVPDSPQSPRLLGSGSGMSLRGPLPIASKHASP